MITESNRIRPQHLSPIEGPASGAHQDGIGDAEGDRGGDGDRAAQEVIDMEGEDLEIERLHLRVARVEHPLQRRGALGGGLARVHGGGEAGGGLLVLVAQRVQRLAHALAVEEVAQREVACSRVRGCERLQRRLQRSC